jgi:hypothetical protein
VVLGGGGSGGEQDRRYAVGQALNPRPSVSQASVENDHLHEYATSTLTAGPTPLAIAVTYWVDDVVLIGVNNPPMPNS